MTALYRGGVPRLRSRKWRNWQTRQIQVLVPARAWRFKSSLPHIFDPRRLAGGSSCAAPSSLPPELLELEKCERGDRRHVDCPILDRAYAHGLPGDKCPIGLLAHGVVPGLGLAVGGREGCEVWVPNRDHAVLDQCSVARSVTDE